VSCASDLIRKVGIPIPCLVPYATPQASPQQPSAHAEAALLADSDDEVPILRFHLVLLWFCVVVMMGLLLHALLCFLVFPSHSIPLLALDLPCRLVAGPDALLGMDNIDLLLP
jgi:hypothetical protein